jgi:rhodanese-related sulfurtransferase
MKSIQITEIIESQDNEDIVILDFRTQAEVLETGYPKGAILCTGMNEDIQWLKNVSNEFEYFYCLLPTHNQKEITKLAEDFLGKKKIKGMIEGGFEAYKQADLPLDYIIGIEADEYIIEMKFADPKAVDIRPLETYKLGHIKHADHLAADDLIFYADNLPDDEIYYVYDTNGILSTLIISFLKKNNLHNYYLLLGGYEALLTQGAEIGVGNA